jgi:lipopolysaccharide heptosyltransferase II
VKRILIIRLSSLGDVIMTTPLIKAVKKLYPESIIDYCTKAEYSEIIRSSPVINTIIEADNELTFDNLKVLKKKLKQNNYDLIIDAHNKLNTFYLRLFMKGEKLKLKKYSFRKFMLVKFKINMMKDLPPVIQRYLDILPNKPGNIFPEIATDYSAAKKIADFFASLNIQSNNNIICIIPSSKHFTKTYPPELYAEIINKFDTKKYTFLLTGKGNDKVNIDLIISKTGNNVYNLCDKFNVIETAELMKRCMLVVTGDTGPMHIAEAVGTPILMLAGSSVKEFGFYPQSVKAVILENNFLSCRPCSHIGRDKCPKGHFKCMREISPSKITDYLTV